MKPVRLRPPPRRSADEATVPATLPARSPSALVGTLGTDLRLRPTVALRGTEDTERPSRLAATNRAGAAAGVGRTDRRRSHGPSSGQWCSVVDARAALPGWGSVMPPISMACSSIGFMTAEHDNCAGIVRVIGGDATCECECHREGYAAPKPACRTRRSNQADPLVPPPA